jgi:MFS family permease
MITTALALLRTEPRSRLFFGALVQSSLGTGAAYVALLIIAYERFHSPWALSLVLLAEFVPAMLVGPLLGAAVDRWSRRWCAVTADVIRAGAFAGIAIVDGFEATVALALLAGLGTALFRPAALAGIPSLVPSEKVPAATSLYGATIDFGYTAGPAIAAVALFLVGPEDLLLLNALTFAISAGILASLPFGGAVAETNRRQGAAPSLLGDAYEGLRASLRMPGVRVIIVAFAIGMFFGGLFNVIELPFATDVLGTGSTGYSVLVAVYGLGFVVGSLSGSRGGDPARLKRRYLLGLVMTAAGTLAAGASSALAPAILAFGIGGFGNGLAIVHQRLLFQKEVAAPLQGRVFAVTDALTAWGFVVGFIAAGGIVAALGPRPPLLITGAGELLLAAGTAFALRRHWLPHHAAQEAEPSGLGDRPRRRRHRELGHQGPHLVDGSRFWLTLLDDLGERRDDLGVELRPGVRD